LLLDLTLIEEELEILFTSLLVRCIVLLEDINIVGLIRELSKSKEKVVVLVEDKKGSNKLNITTLIKAL
jgi:hypothetical protein